MCTRLLITEQTKLSKHENNQPTYRIVHTIKYNCPHNQKNMIIIIMKEKIIIIMKNIIAHIIQKSLLQIKIKKKLPLQLRDGKLITVSRATGLSVMIAIYQFPSNLHQKSSKLSISMTMLAV